MPINLQWRPNNTPTTNDTPENLGLEIGGDDSAMPASVAGRVRLVEVPDASSSKGTNENQQPRNIANFIGTFFRDISAPAASRITFDIFIKNPINPKNHDGLVEGFDPECMFGIDALIFTFVNRRFVVWFPFHVDSRSEGKFLDIQAVAEMDAGNNSFHELGKSNVLSLGIRRKHRVASTSQFNNAAITYTTKLVGNVVTHSEEYLLGVQLQISATQASPGFLPVPPAGSGAIQFQAYVANSLLIMLATNLLDGITPTAANLTSRIPNLPNAASTVTKAKAQIKQKVASTVVDIFTDAGFTGVRAPWQDEPAASQFNTAFTAAFIQRRGVWGLANANNPFATAFWNFTITGDDSISGAGAGEQLQFNMTTPRNVGGANAFIANALPIGSGNKNVTDTIRLNSSLLLDTLLNFSGTAKTFKDEADFLAACDWFAAHIGIIVAHEVGHSLGLMHTPHVETGDYSEQNGSPVLSIMSEGVDNGGFGTNMKFAMQTKVMWEAAFHVSPNFTDTTLQNKTWQPNEVKTVAWTDRKNRFMRLHGESGMRIPPFSSFTSSVPPFAVAWPTAQKGTKI